MSDGVTDAANGERKLIEEWQRQTIDNFLKDLSTSELVSELCKRDGVWHEPVPEEGTYSICIRGERVEYDKSDFGKARILVVRE